MFNARLIDPVPTTEPLVLLAIEDITERKRAIGVTGGSGEVPATTSWPCCRTSCATRSPRSTPRGTAPLKPAIGRIGDGSWRDRPALERQTGQLRRLVEDLLDVSRLAHGKITLENRAARAHP